MKNCRITGKYPYLKIIEKNIQLGMITLERGLISLTLDGAKKIGKTDSYWIDIYDDFTLVGSVFAPGIKDADTNIRIGDDVIIFQNGTICGVGVTQMNGQEMNKAGYGEAVKIRHRC